MAYRAMGDLDKAEAHLRQRGTLAVKPDDPLMKEIETLLNSALAYDAYFVYPEELKTVARVQVFRDFLVAKAQRWNF